MQNIILLLIAWVPESYFMATNGLEAMAWGIIATLLTVIAIAATIEENKKASAAGTTRRTK